MGFLAQKAEHQRTKLKVTGSTLTAQKSTFFFYPAPLHPTKKKFKMQTNQARLGLVAVDIMSESLQCKQLANVMLA